MNDTIRQISENLVSTLNKSLGIWYLIILNAFGVIAICCKVVEYQSKKRTFAFILAMASQVLWVLYFLFSGDFLSAISCLITFSSVMIFTQREQHKWARSIWWLIGFLLIQMVMTVFTFKSWQDIFPTLAGITGVFAYYCIDMRKYRATSFFYALSWLLNSICKGYVLALISDASSLISVSVGILRYDILKKTKLDELEQKD